MSLLPPLRLATISISVRAHCYNDLKIAKAYIVSLLWGNPIEYNLNKAYKVLLKIVKNMFPGLFGVWREDAKQLYNCEVQKVNK